MGRLTGGPYYDLIGRTGNNVGRRVNGKNTFSMRPHKGNRVATMLQLAVQFRLGMIASWLSWITPIIEVGFQDHEEGESAMNASVSYNIKNAVTGVYPNQAIDYPKVLFSRGRVSPPSNPVMATTVDAQLDLTWAAARDNGIGSLTDMATVVVYNPSKGHFAVMVDAAARSALGYDMAVPLMWSGDNVQAYMHFVSADGKAVSNSLFLGATVVM